MNLAFVCTGDGKRSVGFQAEGCVSVHPVLVTVRPKLTVTIDTNVNSTILTLEDDVRSWRPGDTLVVASTDYSMYQAEEFQVLPCRTCAFNQVKVAGRPVPTLWSQWLCRVEVLGTQDKGPEESGLGRESSWRSQLPSQELEGSGGHRGRGGLPEGVWVGTLR